MSKDWWKKRHSPKSFCLLAFVIKEGDDSRNAHDEARRISVADGFPSDLLALVAVCYYVEIQSLARPMLRFGKTGTGRWMRSFFIL
jgi:hypothetical protein